MSGTEDPRDDRALSRCEAVQLALMEAAGHSGLLTPEERLHLEGCAECSRAAAAEAALARAFAQAPGGDDPDLAGVILARLPRRRLGWRALAWLPAVAAVALLAGGAALAGGVPGAGPAGLSLVTALAGWPLALAIVARALAEHVPLAVVVLAFVVAGLAAAGAVAATRRWCRSEAWLRE